MGAKVSTIDIGARHALDHEQAQQAAETLAQDLSAKFDIDYGWDGDHIHFERPGVHGQIQVDAKDIHITAHLGFMLMMLKAPIEQEIIRYLKDHFGCNL
jgi:putative polyhydroxyalkanoate system protein